MKKSQNTNCSGIFRVGFKGNELVVEYRRYMDLISVQIFILILDFKYSVHAWYTGYIANFTENLNY